jgi:hypothetical protein
VADELAAAGHVEGEPVAETDAAEGLVPEIQAAAARDDALRGVAGYVDRQPVRRQSRCPNIQRWPSRSSAV